MRRKSKVQGIYKKCRCLTWEKCQHPWWGRFAGNQNRVSLERWSGQVVSTKEAAKYVFARMQGAVLAGTFDKRGERSQIGVTITFDKFLAQYREGYIDQYRVTSNWLKWCLGW